MNKIEQKVRELGYELPNPPKPVASYVPAVRVGNFVYISGQGATKDGKPLMQGHIGAELTCQDGYKAAEICAVNALSVLRSEIGDLDKVKRIDFQILWKKYLVRMVNTPEALFLPMNFHLGLLWK